MLAERPRAPGPAGPELGSRSPGREAAWRRTVSGALVHTGPCKVAPATPQEHFLQTERGQLSELFKIQMEMDKTVLMNSNKLKINILVDGGS